MDLDHLDSLISSTLHTAEVSLKERFKNVVSQKDREIQTLRSELDALRQSTSSQLQISQNTISDLSAQLSAFRDKYIRAKRQWKAWYQDYHSRINARPSTKISYSDETADNESIAAHVGIDPSDAGLAIDVKYFDKSTVKLERVSTPQKRKSRSRRSTPNTTPTRSTRSIKIVTPIKISSPSRTKNSLASPIHLKVKTPVKVNSNVSNVSGKVKSNQVIYKVNPATNGGLQYAYTDVVRGHQRKNLHAQDCDCCNKFYEMMGSPPPSMAPKWRSPKADESRRSGREQLIQDASRHRARWSRPLSPPGFWDVEFPTSSQEELHRAEARKRKLQQDAHRETESKKREGKWRRVE